MAEAPMNKHRTIKAQLKSTKTAYREPENPVRFAFEKELREFNKTRKVFEVDPYAEVYQFRNNLYGIYTLSLDGMGDPWSYLIEGPEHGLLIDTGFGIGDLKGLVHELIGEKPFYVTNTHSHFDHAYGNFQFDEVFCHEYEVPLLQSKMNPHIWDYLFDENGKGNWADFDRADLVAFREYKLTGIPDGYIFDLGEGYEVELVFLPGHSPGHAGFLDKRNKIFFPGDDCCCAGMGVGYMGPKDDPYTQYATVEALYKELVKLTARLEEFDSLFPGHFIVDTGPVMLVNLQEACKTILDDPTQYDQRQIHKFQGYEIELFGKQIYQSGYMTYTKDSLYMNRSLPEDF